MALNVNGRVYYIDAAGTHAAVFPANTAIFLATAKLIAGAGAAATLTIYADPAATAGKEIDLLDAAADGTDDSVYDPMTAISSNGLTLVLAGTGAKAFVEIA